MNIFNIIERNFFRIPGSRYEIGCRLRNSDTVIKVIKNNSRIPTDTLVSILNDRQRVGGMYAALRCDIQEDLDIFVKGRYAGGATTEILCIVKHIQDMPVGFSQRIADTVSFIFREGRLPSRFLNDMIEAEADSHWRLETETPLTTDESKKKNTIIDVDCLIDTDEFIDKISKCCNNNSAKIIVRHGDDELKIVDTCIEKEFLYIDVVNPKKLKNINEEH